MRARSDFEVGDRIEYGGILGVVTALLPELGQVRIKLDDGQGWRVSPGELKTAPKDAPPPPDPASL